MSKHLAVFSTRTFWIPNGALKVTDQEDLLLLQHSSYESPYEQSTLLGQALDFEEREWITVKRNRQRYRKNELDTEQSVMHTVRS